MHIDRVNNGGHDHCAIPLMSVVVSWRDNRKSRLSTLSKNKIDLLISSWELPYCMQGHAFKEQNLLANQLMGTSLLHAMGVLVH